MLTSTKETGQNKMNDANLINLEAYETVDDDFAYLATFYIDSAKKENRLGYKKARGFLTAEGALKEGFAFIFQNENLTEWTEAKRRSNPNKKTYTYVG